MVLIQERVARAGLWVSIEAVRALQAFLAALGHVRFAHKPAEASGHVLSRQVGSAATGALSVFVDP